MMRLGPKMYRLIKTLWNSKNHRANLEKIEQNVWNIRTQKKFVIYQWNFPKRLLTVSANLIFNLIFLTKRFTKKTLVAMNPTKTNLITL
jgi:hypothetical protein